MKSCRLIKLATIAVAVLALAGCDSPNTLDAPKEQKDWGARSPKTDQQQAAEPNTSASSSQDFPELCEELMAPAQDDRRAKARSSCLAGKSLQERLDNPECLTHKNVTSCEALDLTKAKY